MLNRNKFISFFSLLLILSAGCDRGKPAGDILVMNNEEKEIRYLALGDSYTIGESVAVDLRWPVQLADSLNKAGVNIGEPVIIARTGWTTDELMDGIVNAQVNGTFDMVSLLIGVNNQFRGRESENFRSEFSELLSLATEFAGNDSTKVFVLSIPDWGVMPFAEGRNRENIAEEIDIFNGICLDECNKRGITFYDITPISRQVGSKPEYIASDGLHPSGSMYAAWVNFIYTGVEAIVK